MSCLRGCRIFYALPCVVSYRETENSSIDTLTLPPSTFTNLYSLTSYESKKV